MCTYEEWLLKQSRQKHVSWNGVPFIYPTKSNTHTRKHTTWTRNICSHDSTPSQRCCWVWDQNYQLSCPQAEARTIIHRYFPWSTDGTNASDQKRALFGLLIPVNVTESNLVKGWRVLLHSWKFAFVRISTWSKVWSAWTNMPSFYHSCYSSFENRWKLQTLVKACTCSVGVNKSLLIIFIKLHFHFNKEKKHV